MKISLPVMLTTLARLEIAVAVGGVCLLLSSAALAQTSVPASVQQLPTNERSTSPFGGSSDSRSMFDLIHRAVFNNPRTLDEFGSEHNRNLGDEVSNFRRQQELLLQQSPGAVGEGSPSQAPGVQPVFLLD